MTAFVTGGSGFIGGRLIERLVADGVAVRALARSDRSAAAVGARGAEPVRGDLGDVDALTAGARGCDTVYHLAANVEMWGPWDDFVRDNVVGTQHVLDAARAAGVVSFVHCGTEAALIAGEPLRNVDETAPLRPDSPAPYPSTKARAEQAVRDADRDGFRTVVIRPRFVWGAGDTTLLSNMVEMVESGRFAWIGGGRQLTDVTHVDNVVEGLVLGAQKGRGGEAYFVTDGEPVVFREFVSALLGNSGRPCTHPVDSGVGRGTSRGCLRSPLACRADTGPAAADPVHLLGVLAGMHDQHRQGQARTRLPARQITGRRPRRTRRQPLAARQRRLAAAAGTSPRRRGVSLTGVSARSVTGSVASGAAAGAGSVTATGRCA